MNTVKSYYKKVESYLNQMEGSRLILPFMGCYSEALLILRNRPFEYIWINDSDAATASMWRAIRMYPLKLCSKIGRYTPDKYDQVYFGSELKALQRIPADVEEVTDVALKKIVLMNKDVWNPGPLSRYVKSTSNLLKKQPSRFTSWDFETILNDHTEDDIVFMDVELDKAELWRLSEKLYNINNWLLLTSPTAYAHQFFSWANIEPGKNKLIISG